MPLLSGENLTLGYGGRKVVENLHFSIHSGDYVCVIGENGSGKSTFMKTLLGLIPPISGQILLGDGLKQNEIGYLPQQMEAQKDFPASVREIVLSGCLNRCGLRPCYTKEEKAIAKQNMEKLGIAPLSKRCYRELSGGQQQRVLLARALCATKKALLLDEPVAGLDTAATAAMYETISELNKRDRITIIMISHDMKAALEYASHILHIGSTPLYFGSKADYLKTEIGGKNNG